MVVPQDPVTAAVPQEDGVDVPDTVADQCSWLADAGFDVSTVFADGDLAILQADRG